MLSMLPVQGNGNFFLNEEKKKSKNRRNVTTSADMGYLKTFRIVSWSYKYICSNTCACTHGKLTWENGEKELTWQRLYTVHEGLVFAPTKSLERQN